jgi:hypothetical protein
MGIAKPVVANQYLYVAPSILEELAMLAARHGTSPSAILAASWELGKHALYDRILPEAYVMPSGPTLAEAKPGPSSVPAIAHAPADVPAIDLDPSRTTIECGFQFAPRMHDEVVRMAVVADRSLSWMLRESYLLARRQLL